MRFIDDDTGIADDDGIVEGSGWKAGEALGKSTTSFPLTVFFYQPSAAANQDGNSQPAFEVVRFPDAESAIRSSFEDFGIVKIAILGYGMLSAGLTVQTIIQAPLNSNLVQRRAKNAKRKTVDGSDGTYNRIYCAKYLALATTTTSSLDKNLQLAGRTFAELKEHKAPLNWKIQVLGVTDIVDTLTQYSNMEEILADINTPVSLLEQRRRLTGGVNPSDPSDPVTPSDPSDPSDPLTPSSSSSTAESEAITGAREISSVRTLTLCEALKESFDATLVASNNYGSLGQVGVRRGEFSSILGLTNDVAIRRAKAAEAARKKALESTSKLTQSEVDRIARDNFENDVMIEAVEAAEPTEPTEPASTNEETLEVLAVMMDQDEDEDMGKVEDQALVQQLKRSLSSSKADDDDENDDDSRGKRKRFGALIARALRSDPLLPHMLASFTGKSLRVISDLAANW
jgi:hypothetical protein